MLGKVHLDVQGMNAVVAIQAAWNMAVAVLMLTANQLKASEVTGFGR